MTEDTLVILVVDDDPLIRQLVQDALDEGGFGVAVASSGEEAIGLLDGQQPCRGLVTDVDLGRGRMTGWDLARHARERDPGFPVVYMTGDSAAEWNVNGVPNSVLLTKPFAPAQVVAAVAQLLNSSDTSGT